MTGHPLVYDALVASGGLSEAHRIVIDEVPAASRVLDAGCAGGYLAERLRDDKRCEVTGIDLNPAAVAAARERGIEASQLDLNVAELPAEGCDVVVFADVLEHLIDPLRVLRSARTATTAIISLPNIAHWSARRELLLGRWPQRDHGLFDATHLHFFTRKTAHELAREAGATVSRERFTTAPLPFEHRLRLPSTWRRSAADQWPELFAFQVILTLR